MPETTEMFAAEHTKAHEQSPLQPKDVRHDFWLSFRFSQGNQADDKLQYKLLKAILKLYPQEELMRISSMLQTDGFRDQCCSLTVPHQHLDKKNEDVKVEFANVFDYAFIPALRNQVSHNTPFEESDDPLLDTILRGMISCDERYQTRPRPGRNPTKDDLHESYVRKYILEGTETGSPRYDTLFRMLNEYQLRSITIVPAQMRRLELMWNTNHPQQTFRPL